MNKLISCCETELPNILLILMSISNLCPFTGGSLDTRVLLSWFQTRLNHLYPHLFTINDLNESWRDGLGFCALVELYRPRVCQLATFKNSDRRSRVQIGLTLIEQEFGVEPMLSADDVCRDGPVDKLAMLSYLAQVNEALENEVPKKGRIYCENDKVIFSYS